MRNETKKRVKLIEKISTYNFLEGSSHELCGIDSVFAEIYE